MLTIAATVIEIPRVKVLPPQDGVHRASNQTGFLKGCHSFVFELPDGTRRLVPKGQTGFWWVHKPDAGKAGVGVKVFYKIENRHSSSWKAVKKAWRNRKNLAPYGVMPAVHKLVEVKLDLTYRGKRHTTHAWGIVCDAVAWPVEAWERYAQGHPYDFSCLGPAEHPKHSPEGYIAFADMVHAACHKARVTVCGGDARPKLGDISYCTVRRRWFLVDDG